MKINSILFIFALLFIGFVQAQNPVFRIEFEETTHDFGTLEQGAPAETIFHFKNISDKPLTLATVKASCGCTTPTWPKEEIPAGGKGEIAVRYNSSRIGAFNKSVTVTYSDEPSPVRLYIKGTVNAKPGATSPALDNSNAADGAKPIGNTIQPNISTPRINYQHPKGALAFEKIVESVPVLTSEEIRDVEFRFRNISSLPVKILKAKTQIDKELTLLLKDEVIQPGQESTLKIQMSGPAIKNSGQVDGYFSKRITIYTDEPEGANKNLSINANFKRVFTEEEKASSPTIVFETKSIEGGKIIEGEKFTYDFKFTNTGKSPLKIISAKPSCGCTAVAPIVESIAPGESASILATFDSKGKVGMQSKSISVQTNDIENPVVGLRFTVEVVRDPFHSSGTLDAQ